MFSTDRRSFVATMLAGAGLSLVAGSGSAAEVGAGRLGVCMAAAGTPDHTEALSAALEAVRTGVAEQSVRAAVAANRCPFCGCSLIDPFTGKPLGKHANGA